MRAAVGESPRLFYFTIKITFYFFKLLGILDLGILEVFLRNSRFRNSRSVSKEF